MGTQYVTSHTENLWKEVPQCPRMLPLIMMSATVCPRLIEVSNFIATLAQRAVVEIRVRNWSAIFLKIGHFVGY